MTPVSPSGGRPSVGGAWLLLTRPVQPESSFFTSSHILSDFVWYAFVSGAVTFGRRFLGDISYRVMVAGCALFILSFGVYSVGEGYRP